MISMGLQSGHEEGQPINLEGHDGMCFKVARHARDLINCPCFEIDNVHELASVNDKQCRALLAHIHVECFGDLRWFVFELDDRSMYDISNAIASPFVTFTCKDLYPEEFFMQANQ